jgi:hypothetical protein
MDERVKLPEALTVVQQAKEMIEEVEGLLPPSSNRNFRERLVAHVAELEETPELDDVDLEFRRKAYRLLALYRERFGVKDIVDDLEEI